AALVDRLLIVVGAFGWRGFGAAVEHSEHDRFAWIVVEEADHHFVADLRSKEVAAFVPCVEARDTRPDPLATLLDEREAHFDAIFAFVIDVGGDDADLQPARPRHERARRRRADRTLLRGPAIDMAELDMRLPAVHRIVIVAHPRDEDVTREAIADAA